MAAFCGNCGNTLGENDRICGNCGAPVAGKAPAAKAASVAKKYDTNKIIALSAIGVVALILIIVIASVASKNGGYKGAINKTLNRIVKQDIDGLVKNSSCVVDGMLDTWGEDPEDYYDELVDGCLDRFEDEVGGNVKSVKAIVEDVDEISDRKLKDAKEELEDYYDVDVDSIKKVVKVNTTLVVKGKKKTEKIYDVSFVCIKEKGGWKAIYGSGFGF